MRSTHLLLTLATLSCPACAVEYDDDDFRSAPDSGGNSGGGTVFNTNALDDVRFSELSPKEESKGSYQPGFTLDKMILVEGLPLPTFAVESGEIVGFDELAGVHKGAELIESTWQIAHAGGTYSMQLAKSGVDDGVPRYNFVHINEIGLPSSTCPPGPDGDGLARVLAGFSLDEGTGDITDAPETTYFACDTGATGKAADLGFYDLALTSDKGEPDPWLPLELAIRVIRADYCYNGDSYTKPGTPVWIEDYWGVIGPDPAKQDNPIEAVWGADGLLCGGTGRQQPDIDCGVQPPKCKQDAPLSDYPGGLFLTRIG